MKQPIRLLWTETASVFPVVLRRYYYQQKPWANDEAVLAHRKFNAD